MGCCSPNYHKQVEEQEEQINDQGSERIPLWLKLSSGIIVLAAIGFYIF
ncbi:hypothetical protein LCL89_13575 [Halobacillus yeomjeoni]|uniref:Uncharacterized protein n=1 Tax=Halobacillus yeomjeoni TaxID=311194 RepID=A0A931HYA3_9BACI|nr:hypothetical protein [Halobacillus yeomjeoni]MBH0231610.1 hypothetical protein [Halobacillus yeomjeoni]MCA0985069.1 hypothetical protein [Halobacillus yeomjeoni]